MQIKPGATVTSLGGQGEKKIWLVPSKLFLPHQKI